MIKHSKYFIFLFLCTLYAIEDFNFSHSGYTNIYGINRISDQSLIKVPFKLLSYDLTLDYKEFSINTKFGLEHKLKTDKWYDISNSNVDYKFEFREYYLSYFPSFGEISLGKKIHAWGAVDGNSPLDILNPTNFYYLFTDLDETKIGRESISLDLFASDNIKIQLLAMPGHGIDFIPQNDPNFPIQLPASPKTYQFLDQSDLNNPIEYGGYIQTSLNNMDWSLHYFSGYDRTFNLYGANVWQNTEGDDLLQIIDTVFSYRRTEMIGVSNVTFIGDITLRADFAYFNTDDGDYIIDDRGYQGIDPILDEALAMIDPWTGDSTSFKDFLGFPDTPEYIQYFDFHGSYYQYCLQLEYGLPLEIDFTTQIFGYNSDKIKFTDRDINITSFNFSVKDLFFPGMGSSMGTLCNNGVLLNFTKRFFDDTMEFQMTNLLDTKDKGQLHQLKWTYDIMDNMSLSFLLYKGIGNRITFPDITFIDDNDDGCNDDFDNNETGKPGPDGKPDADMIDESLFYPFNAMDDFSHIRFQLQYFF